MPYDNSELFIPSVFDRADGGLTTQWGTPTPAGSLGINWSDGQASLSGTGANPVSGPDIFGNIQVFEESSDSPIFDVGEQTTITHKFFVDYLTMQNIVITYKRGYEIYDNTSGPLGPNLSRVLSNNAQPIPKTGGLIWTLAQTTECMSFPGPPDEMVYDIVELNPAAEKHPRYSALSYGQRSLVRTAEISDFADVTQQAKSNFGTFPSSSNQWANQQGQAYELYFKKQKGEDSFYLSGYKLQYSQYFWYPQDINPGGYIEDPFTVIPYQFWTDDFGENIFSLNATWNPNLYPNPNATPPLDPPYGLSWLRQTDTQVLNRTWWKITYTWIGAPLGHWDNEWYNSALQPLQVSSSYGGTVLS